MGRRLLATLTILAMILTSGSDLSAARNKESFEKLAAEILESLQSFYPVLATEQGIHSYDRRLADYSSKAVKQMKNRLTEYTKKL